MLKGESETRIQELEGGIIGIKFKEMASRLGLRLNQRKQCVLGKRALVLPQERNHGA